MNAVQDETRSRYRKPAHEGFQNFVAQRMLNTEW